MKKKPPDVTRLVRNLVRLHGGDAGDFEAAVREDGSIAVHNATTAVYYVPDAWMSRFNRQLHHGSFDAPLVQAMPHTRRA